MTHNPLVGNATDDGLSAVRDILATSPADGQAIVDDLRAWLRTDVETEALKQILNLYASARLTSSADALLLDQAQGLV